MGKREQLSIQDQRLGVRGWHTIPRLAQGPQPAHPPPALLFAAVSHPTPIRAEDIARFDAVIDARSPAEFAEDHIPGAINCPVLDDAERASVGTLYVQQGAFEARRVGGAMVAAHLAEHLRGAFADQPATWRPLVYCWRGGMRSGAMVQWMRLVGWKAEQLAGGYKAFRHHVIEQIGAMVPRMRILAIVGATGSAKTRILHALASRGAQVLDLEGLARHKGSLLGGLPGVAQPSQKHFETQIWSALHAMDLSRPICVEGESARIGRLSVPPLLVRQLRAAPCIEIDAPPGERLAYLLRDYAYLGDEPETLIERLALLTEMHGRETVQRWQAWARAHELAPLFDELMRQHYDPHYERSQARHFTQWPTRERITAADLSEGGIATLAETIAGLPESCL